VFGVLVFGEEGVDKDACDASAFDRPRPGVGGEADESGTAVTGK